MSPLVAVGRSLAITWRAGLLPLAGLALLASGCGSGAEPSSPWERVATFALPEELREISALAVLDEERVAALQDENGRVYVLEVGRGEVVETFDFGPDGDYEGLERVGERLFALTSDGTLHEIEGWQSGRPTVRRHDTGLGEACNAEGLGYEASRDRLLVACKRTLPGGTYPVYRVDPARGRLDPIPIVQLPARLAAGERRLRPSAVAVEPGGGRIVVLGSGPGVLVVVAPDGGVEEVWPLGEDAFEQPEGLAFLPGGDLLVASEGDVGPPVLARFTRGLR